jgi:5-methylcytosine-specific restriction endonuclease McrA
MGDRGLNDSEWFEHCARLDRHLFLARKQGGRCGMCGKFLPVAAGDPHHIRRRSQGGTDTVDNLVLLHRECHRWVHTHIAEARELGLLYDPQGHHL